MSSGRYAPLPNSRPDRDGNDEMDAAFDDSDDEGDDSESRPLNPVPTSPRATHSSRPSAHIPGTYDFENVDYDYPPPGSPPGPSAMALPNEFGNSNGLVPDTFDVNSAAPGPRRGWFSRTAAAVLPSHYIQRFGMGSRNQVVGNNNDGVFANVTAKPTAPIRVQDGDNSYLVPEDTRAEAPPSYASAQADAVPQYWETTVHAPFASGVAGEMIIDSLPSGTLFSFLWNMLVSISFQLIGFLLTYVLHQTHAARLGSRAGLGITLIQYGFALRSRVEASEEANSWSGWASPPRPTFSTAAEAVAYYNSTADALAAGDTLTQEQANEIVADATSEWLSFFLMTIGWFILLTSVLGFWRVKRWESGVLASQRDNPGAPPPQQSGGPFMAQFERGFGLRGMTRGDLFRQGLGFGPRHDEQEQGDASPDETEFMIPADTDPERVRQLEEAIRNERRLHAELRAAGLI
ncbi:hypothetical protein DFH08DRAFT_762289 [Mycena albidolilacea]|uniref:Metal homeostatis protein bsd2 n=1 Tax=Mycena albidolilacea TaxID=1033008 RepID=A0AAD7AVA0_9AGAR|nr:hypothetical protein DFH08DRAFT_762289 [Mycena albidolilacea]